MLRVRRFARQRGLRFRFLRVHVVERIFGVARYELDRTLDVPGNVAKHDQITMIDALPRLLQRAMLLTSGPRDRRREANDLEQLLRRGRGVDQVIEFGNALAILLQQLFQRLQSVTFRARGAPLARGVAPKQARRALGLPRLRKAVQDQQQVPRVDHRSLTPGRSAEPLLEFLRNTPRLRNERRHEARLTREPTSHQRPTSHWRVPNP